MLSQGRSRIAPETVLKLIWCFGITFLLTHKFGTVWAIEMTADREEWSELLIGAKTAIRHPDRNRSGTSLIRRSCIPPRHGLGRQRTDRNLTQLQRQKLQLHDGSWSLNQPLLMTAIPTTLDDGHSNHPQIGKNHGHPQPTRQQLMLVNNEKSGHL